MGPKRVIKPADERKKELVDAARALFIERGYEQTTMSNIAERAGVAQGTFYIYFGSKQDVLMAIMREMLETLGDTIRQLADRADIPAPAILRQALNDCFGMVSREPRLLEAIYLQANYSLPALLLEQAAPALRPLIASIIERGVGEGSMKVSHPLLAADFLWTAGYRLFEMEAQRLITQGQDGPAAPPVSAVQEAFWEFVGQGLGLARAE